MSLTETIREQGFTDGYAAGITKVLKDATEEQFKAEAKRRGYNLIKIPEKVTMLPCVCGSKRINSWYSMGLTQFICTKCGLPSSWEKNERQAKLSWNAMIEEKMKDGKTD